jgi:hypothetical protein
MAHREGTPGSFKIKALGPKKVVEDLTLFSEWYRGLRSRCHASLNPQCILMFVDRRSSFVVCPGERVRPLLRLLIAKTTFMSLILPATFIFIETPKPGHPCP